MKQTKYINFILDSDVVELIDMDASNNQRSRTSQIISIIKNYYSDIKFPEFKNIDGNENNEQ
jgi:hypothetical protein